LSSGPPAKPQERSPTVASTAYGTIALKENTDCLYSLTSSVPVYQEGSGGDLSIADSRLDDQADSEHQ